jgi:hypothetical protein
MKTSEKTPNPSINLVCTRLTQGEHAIAHRWYSDHVQLLLSAPELQQATLYRCTTALQGSAPDYACIYDFSSHEEFLRFEHGEPKAQARELTNAAPGRDRLEIVQREQYSRFLNKRWHRPELGIHKNALLLCLKVPQANALAVQRWIGDGLHQLHACAPLTKACAYMHVKQADSMFLHLETASQSIAPTWEMLQFLLAQGASGFGQAPASWAVQWAAQMHAVTSWRR